MRQSIYAVNQAMICIVGILVFSLGLPGVVRAGGPIIIDHTSTNIRAIPEDAIEQAKNSLHIAYGHTSHGSQLTSGMGSNGTQLDDFMSANGATPGLYVWRDGVAPGALDLDNYFVSGDLGNPDRYTWAQRTRAYLDDPANADVNVVIWSWCGQANTTIANIDIYLNLMETLIADYPHVDFVFMTGHLDGTGPTGRLHLANEHIRSHCIANNRILYDFADIESYDPDGLVNYMELDANDNCDYDSDGDGSRDANWATVWQNFHVEGVDWWASGAAHSQHLNGNLKGYAAWWLWATLAGWNRQTCEPGPTALVAVADTAGSQVTLTWTDNSDLVNETLFTIQRRVNNGIWEEAYATVSPDVTTFTDTAVTEGSYAYRVTAYYGSLEEPCFSALSNTAALSLSHEVPESPSDLGASLDQLSVALSWIDNSQNEGAFILERQTDTGSFDLLAELGADATSYTDNTVASLHTYTYRVKAVNAAGESGYSNEESIYMPEQALTLTLVQDVDGYTGCTDAYLNAASPDTNYGTTLYTYLGGSYDQTMAIRFELPGFLQDKEILSARLTLFCWSVSGHVEGNTLDLYELTESWEEETATWNSRQTGVAWTSPGGTHTGVPLDSVEIESASFYPRFDITDMVRQWASSAVDNAGLLLRNDTATQTGIKGSEYSEYGRPSLEITYTARSECTPDMDQDSDVDGEDLALFAADLDHGCVEHFALSFGNGPAN